MPVYQARLDIHKILFQAAFNAQQNNGLVEGHAYTVTGVTMVRLIFINPT